MTDPGHRFCSRCGTALVAGMPFCPGCGFNTAEVADRQVLAVDDGDEVHEGAASRAGAPDTPDARSTGPGSPYEARLRRDQAPRGAPIFLGALVIAAGLVGFGLLMRPPGDGPTAPANGSPRPGGAEGSGLSPAAPSAPIVGLTIQSPPEGQAVATKEVTVIGLAPPGLTITRDVSFFPDQHANVDGTGHWAMNVDLEEGENELVFRIGDDRSTEQRLRVTYAPPPAP